MNSRSRRRKILSIVKSVPLLVLICLTVTGCSNRQTFKRDELAPEKKAEIVSTRPAALHKYYIDLEEEGDRNAVLNYMRIGRKAYELQYFDEAREALDGAIFGIEQVYGYDQKAADVRSLWIEEGAKSFKGEPYERAMAFFYSGMLYLEAGDFDNARASFKAGQLQDAFAEEQQNRCDFALLMFLEGWCSAVTGDWVLANEDFNEALQIRKGFAKPVEHNVLIVAETGTSPRKVADGPGHSQLKFRRGRGFTEQKVRVTINADKSVEMFPIEDIFWQATSRGGRAVDSIIAGKAEFRVVASQVGETLADIGGSAVVVSPLLDGSGNVGLISGAVGLVGVTTMAIAQSSRPHADTRYWDLLPDSCHILTKRLQPGDYTLKFEYLDANGAVVKGKTVVKKVTKKAGESLVVWVPSPSL